jgi:lysozyme
MIQGIDVSDVQGTINWPKVYSTGIRFALIKCGNGNTEIDGKASDELFDQNVAGARAAGLVVGAYHFVYPLPSGPGLPAGRAPEEQAKLHFVASGGLGTRRGDLPTFIDFEWPDPSEWAKYKCSQSQIADWAARYATTLDALQGRRCGVYTDEWWWTSIEGANILEMSGRPFWPANPVEVLPEDGASPWAIGPFAGWSVWQWSQRSILPGIAGRVDRDCIANEAALSALLNA